MKVYYFVTYETHFNLRVKIDNVDYHICFLSIDESLQDMEDLVSGLNRIEQENS
jgi:hypothetical protein